MALKKMVQTIQLNEILCTSLTCSLTCGINLRVVLYNLV